MWMRQRRRKDEIDVLILCGGSATDLPVQTPKYAQWFNVVDSFDTHARFQSISQQSMSPHRNPERLASSLLVGSGLFSLNRPYAAACLPEGENYTFWGKGVSQGHSVRSMGSRGVKDARQYTIPGVEGVHWRQSEAATARLTTREKHTRGCFVVAEEGADQARSRMRIKTMPNYFSDYDTTVHFITEEELKAITISPHGGFVLRSGKTGWNKENHHIIEYSLKLDSNPEFTSSIIVRHTHARHTR